MRTILSSLLLAAGCLSASLDATAETRSPSPSWSEPGQQALTAYETQARALVAALQTGAGPEAVRPQGEALIAIGIGLIDEFVARHPACRDYLRAASAVREQWPGLDHERIERDFHRDAALPSGREVKICYHLKDLIVHPATALVLVHQSPADYRQATHEIEEVIAHLSVVRAQ